jgi:adenylate cyclase
MTDARPEPRLVRAIIARLTLHGWVASVIGAVVVFITIGFFIPVFTDPADRWRLALVNGPLVLAYLPLAGAVLTWWHRRDVREALDWIARGRAPDPREHRRTLRLALSAVRLDLAAWLVGGCLFTAVNAAVQSWGYAVVVGATIWLGGETTCALVYLLCERTLRPMTARALAARRTDATVAPGVRARLLMAWALGTGVPLLGVLVVGVVGVIRPGVDTSYVAAAVIFLGVVATAAGLLATLFAAKAIADPLVGLREGLERIERGDLDARVALDDGSEVGLLQAGFNRMAGGLRERQLIRELFGRQVGEEVARAALRGGTRLGGEEREVGALYVDIVGSTGLALALPPTEVVRLLNRFFRVVVEVVEGHCGLVNKFEGDAALCVFGAPVARADPAGDALACARELATRLSREVPEIDFGIGISAGVAVAGNVGARHRYEYTVIGDPVNEAARLAELSKQRPERVLASDAALGRACAEESAAWMLGDAAVLRGRETPTGLARPRGLGEAGAPSPSA